MLAEIPVKGREDGIMHSLKIMLILMLILMLMFMLMVILMFILKLIVMVNGHSHAPAFSG